MVMVASAFVITASCALIFGPSLVSPATPATPALLGLSLPVAMHVNPTFPRYRERDVRTALRFDHCAGFSAPFELARDNWLDARQRKVYDRATQRLSRAYREFGGGDAASENVQRVFCASLRR